MSNVIGALRFADDLLARATGLIDDGGTTGARHLVARSIREVSTARATPLTFGSSGRDAKNVQLLATDRLWTAYTALDAGAATDARAAIHTARFALDLLLPG